MNASIPALLQSAIALHQQGKLNEAAKIYQDVVGLDQNNFDAMHLLGVVCYQNGQYEQAADFIGRALKINPNVPVAYTNRGNALNVLKRFDAALADYSHAIRLGQGDADTWFNQGNVLRALKRPAEALASYDKAVGIAPKHAEAWSNRGNTLRDLKRFDEAVSSYRKAIALQPNFAEAHNNLGAALHDISRRDEAVASFDKAIGLKPDYAEAYYNRGLSLKYLKRFAESIVSFNQAIKIRPDYAQAHLDKSHVELLTGNFAEGWKDYEWRNKSEIADRPRLTSLDDAKGRTVLVTWEQGFGDTIQFCRYAVLMKEQGARVLFAPQPGLITLLTSLDGGVELVEDGDPARAFDFHIPLMSLPGLFGTVLETIPASAPYLFADPVLMAKWKEKTGEDGFKIGICWKGNSAHKDNAFRSFPVSLFQPLAAIPGVRMISLLKDTGETLSAIEILDGLDAGSDAFVDTAAVMMNLDLVITCDTSIAHLAGALGVPVWLAVKHVAEWRWMMERSDSPWYPTMRLFRQKTDGDWQSVFEDMKKALIGMTDAR